MEKKLRSREHFCSMRVLEVEMVRFFLYRNERMNGENRMQACD